MIASASSRIHHKRGAGIGLPTGSVYVGPGSKWANPYRGEVGASTMARELLSEQYRQWLLMPTTVDPRDGTQRSCTGATHYLGVPFADRPSLDDIKAALAGKDIACACTENQPCHGDVLIALANS